MCVCESIFSLNVLENQTLLPHYRIHKQQSLTEINLFKIRVNGAGCAADITVMMAMMIYDRVSSSLRMSACLHQTLSEWLTSSSVQNIPGHSRSKSIFYDVLVIMLYLLNIDEFINHYMESGLCKMKCSICVGRQ